MTLETAKRIVQEQGEFACKEALAVARGGMTICEKKEDGSRKYIWVKVKPTLTDDESSIDTALKNRQVGKTKQPSKTIKEESQSEPVITSAPIIQERVFEIQIQRQRPSFFERLKNKAVEIWHEIDSIVVE